MSSRYWDQIAAPWGSIIVEVDALGRLCSIDVLGVRPQGKPDPGRCGLVTAQLREYLAGERREFTLAYHLNGTPFQQRVWQALLEIPYGTVETYGELAGRIGQSGAARAVGGANGANRIPIVIPCHRVIASSGKIGGYSGGLDVKRALLAIEDMRLAA